MAADRLLVLIHERTAGTFGPGGAITMQHIRALRSLGVPHDVYRASDAALTPAAIAGYKGILLLWGGTANTPTWINGSKVNLPPVLCIGTGRSEIDDGDGVTTGIATSDAAQPADAYYALTWGDYTCYSRKALDTLMTPTANGTAIMTAPNGGCAIIKTTARNVYFTCNWSSVVRNICFVLKIADIEPVEPIKMTPIFSLDDGWGVGSKSLSGLEDLAAWARARNIIIIVGLGVDADMAGADSTYYESAAVRAMYQANADVFKIVDHDHAHDILAADTAPYDTVALKVAARRAVIANIAARGYDISEDGYLGAMYVAKDQITYKGMQALAEMGVKLLRVYGTGGPTDNNPGLFIFPNPDDPDHPLRLRLSRANAILVTQNGTPTRYLLDNGTGSEAASGYNAQDYKEVVDWLCGTAGLGYMAPEWREEHARCYVDCRPPLVPLWTAETDYELGDAVLPVGWLTKAADRVFYYTCIQAGKSAASEPTWPTAAHNEPGCQVDDGTVKWHVGFNGDTKTVSGQVIDVSGVAGDNVGLRMTEVIQNLIDMSNGWMRFATSEDIKRMVEGMAT